MPGKNIKRIVFGVILVICSAAGVAASFYLLEAKPRFGVGKGAEPLTQGKDPVSDTAVAPQAPDPSGVNHSGKKEGLLWVDRKSSRLIVTLGAANGLSEGRQLIVYEGTNRLGEVIVDAVFETVSYAHAVGKFMNILENTYYRVGTE